MSFNITDDTNLIDIIIISNNNPKCINSNDINNINNNNYNINY